MKAERIESRIENYTSNLSQAVQGGSGAQFSMLLSMISANQDLYRPIEARPASDARFELPESQSAYPDFDELNTPAVVDRLNHSINEQRRGDYAYLVSHIHTEAMMPRDARRGADYFAKVALMSTGRLMLDEIDSSRQQISAHA
ncbi:hypothetical protein [Marinobacterium arenosum]|uniref:hypothetical protein n=1 Tax=Marinobacterium arenosum TaxID=2862496 RepID=UPI001C95A649|nr:hypothetical protein [Marinobacterium arenosum]MBY4678037.1 hypothetical protein [Marinobacterium arenosum]